MIPAEDLEGLLGELEVLSRFSDPDLAARRVPDVSGWSVAQHLEHVYLAAEHNLRAIESIEAGQDDAVAPDPAEAGIEMLATGTIPRGVGRAPARVRPSDDPDPARLEEMRRDLVERWGGLYPERIDTLEELTGRLPHPMIGAFTALEWLRFAFVHTAHHRAIIDEIVAAG